MTETLVGAESALAAIEALAGEGLSAQAMLERAAARIERVVPSDGYFLAATDPQTTLSLGVGVVRDLPAAMCQPTWDYEFRVPDYLKFADMALTGQAVADLHDATGGRPERSARWREYAAATGYRAEVRLTLTAGGGVWGIGQIDRSGDSSRFTPAEKAWLERLAPVLARGLRRALVTQPAVAAAERGPGILVLDADGDVVSATREAEDWLDQIAGIASRGSDGFPVPFEAHAYAAKVRAADAEGAGPLRARLRTRDGTWLLMHGSMLRGTEQLALVIEPAKGSDVAPLIVEAYALTARELEVTRAIARGLGTAEIARLLFLSPHTVRDHVKAVFEKVGVSSRGELVAKVFAEHYAPPPHVAPAD